jgi:hypothetical protein
MRRLGFVVLFYLLKKDNYVSACDDDVIISVKNMAVMKYN